MNLTKSQIARLNYNDLMVKSSEDRAKMKKMKKIKEIIEMKKQREKYFSNNIKIGKNKGMYSNFSHCFIYNITEEEKERETELGFEMRSKAEEFLKDVI